MKLSNVFAKLTFVKSNLVRMAAAVALAGAVLTVAAPAAAAQRGVAVRFDGPRYVRPALPARFYRGPVFYPEYGHRDWRFRHDFYRDHDGYRGFRR